MSMNCMRIKNECMVGKFYISATSHYNAWSDETTYCASVMDWNTVDEIESVDCKESELFEKYRQLVLKFQKITGCIAEEIY